MTLTTKHILSILCGGCAVSAVALADPAPERIEGRVSIQSDWARTAESWQRLLEREPTAQIEYRDLLTRLCHAERQRDPGFACVEATDADYYFACPPDAAVIEFARHELPRETQPPGFALLRILDHWQNRSAIVQDTSGPAGTAVWYLSPEERRTMWRANGETEGISYGLIPARLQPPQDRPVGMSSAYASPAPIREASPPPRPVEPAPRAVTSSPPPPVPAQERVIVHQRPAPPPPAPARVYYQETVPPPPPPVVVREHRVVYDDDDDDDDDVKVEYRKVDCDDEDDDGDCYEHEDDDDDDD